METSSEAVDLHLPFERLGRAVRVGKMITIPLRITHRDEKSLLHPPGADKPISRLLLLWNPAAMEPSDQTRRSTRSTRSQLKRTRGRGHDPEIAYPVEEN